MTEQQLKQAADLLNTKPLKSDNIELGSQCHLVRCVSR